ncbi:glyoxylate/hydroxypyruvate reductase A [Amylibacter ulvae]|uniref:Glyoxylate/hydroxypyruvate reductase A n=1 Tax=Paramylibacter ulvae TaxID=1651968 RepID=A0ABQ3DCT9_9RHOB|nr:glyoxylate/hydroxypyruvate reductase A [Amylibacter ulvae]GHA62679.1 glyoxylate/hydroxypyruvate reductase A [Amylibacter ulvae]
MSIVVSIPARKTVDWWCEMLTELMPDWDVYPMGEEPDPAGVEYALVWRPATGCMSGYNNLKAIVSIGAGIDHVLADEELPKGVPIIRTVGADLTQRMREYVALHVLRHHRDMPAIQESQRKSEWNQIVVPPAPQRRVGVMGLGNLGAAAAQTLAGLGFETVGWSRSPKDIEGVQTYAGKEGLGNFLSGTEILVNLLPLTQHTRGILNADMFNRLKRGASLINAARGPHLVDSDLLGALDSGQISNATLDVFHIEPLPSDHPFWLHPNITVTPHIASLIDAPTGSKIIAANIIEFDKSGTVKDIADASREY